MEDDKTCTDCELSIVFLNAFYWIKKINIIRGKILFNKMLNEFEMVEMKPKRNFILNVNGLSDHLNIKTLY